MSKVSNILRLIMLLNRGRKYTLEELADKLEISKRMVRSYKDDLEMAGIYVTTIRGPYGGYVLDTKTILPSIKIDEKDIAILQQSNNKNFGTLIEKLKIINDGSTDKIYTPNDKFNKFQKAIKENLKIKIVYNSPNKISERIVHPIEMFLFSQNWYVAAFCELKNGIRSFVLDNVESMEILKEKF